jgi:hypothetical protein
MLVPEPNDGVRRAVALALAGSGIDLGAMPSAYTSEWRRAALQEAAARQPGDEHDLPSVRPARRAAGEA